MHEIGFLTNISIALLAALVGGFLARLVRLPVLVGYLIAGVVIGPHTPGITAQPRDVHSVANFGVALLMFAVGVHFSLDQFKSVWKTAVIGGAIQIIGTIGLGILIALGLGWGLYGGVFLGCALALSSTAVMLKLLEERGEQGSNHGKAMLGILIAQDLSVVLMAPLLPALALISTHGAAALGGVAIAMLRGAVLLVATVFLASRGVPALMRRITKMGSQELFLLTGIGICLVSAVVAEQAGLGLALGAFLAGLVISETDYAHELFSQIRPLRDMFAAIFFVSIGMLLDPTFLREHWLPVLVVVVAVAIGKAVISAIAVYVSGQHGKTAVIAGLGLAQIGEFSFVLATIGSDQKLIPAEISGVILSAALISLVIAPFLFDAANSLYQKLNKVPALSRAFNRRVADPSQPDVDCPVARVLIVGFGRVGRTVSNALTAMEIPHSIVDYDGSATVNLPSGDINVIYGDASSKTVMLETQPDCLALAVIALPDASTTQMTVQILHTLAPNLPIIVRVHRVADIQCMRDAGAAAVIHAEFEVGAEMVQQSLGRLGTPLADVDSYLQAIRSRVYENAA